MGIRGARATRQETTTWGRPTTMTCPYTRDGELGDAQGSAIPEPHGPCYGSRSRADGSLSDLTPSSSEGSMESLPEPLSALLGAQCSSTSPAESFNMHVPHVQQSHNWGGDALCSLPDHRDCGLACVLMVLQAFGTFTYNLDDLEQVCSTTSIWTVDLAHMLRFFGLDVMFFTVTIGANPDYAAESFYREHMQEDERRVGRLFTEAEAKGIIVKQLSLTGGQLQAAILSGRYVVVLLIDKRVLNDWRAKKNPRKGCRLSTPTSRSYTGHYVVVCGFNSASKEYIICDPAVSAGPTEVSAECIEHARLSFGTDEDTLLVSKP